jgi:hypothetical protein
MKSSPPSRGNDITPARREENLVVTPVDDETVVYDLERDEVHSLNRASTLVWRSCDGATPVRSAVARLSADLDVSETQSEELWRLAIRQLTDAHLVQGRPAPRVARPDRRQVLRAVGVGLLPVVFTMAAPTIASAQSGGRSGLLPLGAPCTTSSECQSGCCAGPNFRRRCVGRAGTGRGECK